jgi:hypothetical protein
MFILLYPSKFCENVIIPYYIIKKTVKHYFWLMLYLKKLIMETNNINLNTLEKLVQAEAQRRKILWQRKCKKLLWLSTFLIITFIIF